MIFVNYRISANQPNSHMQTSRETHEMIKQLIGIDSEKPKFKPLPYPQTPESARAYFLRYGISLVKQK